jgi:hypothetical protein
VDVTEIDFGDIEWAADTVPSGTVSELLPRMVDELSNSLGCNESKHNIQGSLRSDEDGHEAGVVGDVLLANHVANDTDGESGEVDPHSLGCE